MSPLRTRLYLLCFNHPPRGTIPLLQVIGRSPQVVVLLCAVRREPFDDVDDDDDDFAPDPASRLLSLIRSRDWGRGVAIGVIL